MVDRMNEVALNPGTVNLETTNGLTKLEDELKDEDEEVRELKSVNVGEVDDLFGDLSATGLDMVEATPTSTVARPARQRKVSHRKIIIHDDGQVCASTYNKKCPHEDDPDHMDPPMYHETGGKYLAPISNYIELF